MTLPMIVRKLKKIINDGLYDTGDSGDFGAISAREITRPEDYLVIGIYEDDDIIFENSYFAYGGKWYNTIRRKPITATQLIKEGRALGDVMWVYMLPCLSARGELG